MAYTTINDPTEYFNTVLYTGNGTDDRSITGVGFQPDFLWVKNRSAANGHALVDTTRGATATLRSQATNAEETESNGIQAFESDGFQIGTSGLVNTSSNNYVSWNWLANGGTTSSNSDGSITSTVQANTTAGFSILTFTGTTANQTVGHGLNQAPEIFFVKSRASTSNFWVYTTVVDGTLDFLSLNTTNASGTASNSVPTSSVIHQNQTDSSVAYCFHSVKGYSKIGKYTGNGNSDGTFVYTGFKPAWLMIRNTISGEDWLIWDVTRDAANVLGNPMTGRLKANDSIAEVNGNDIDFLSNGFKIRTDSTYGNGSGNTIIYMAFAESPFVSSDGVPTTAR